MTARRSTSSTGGRRRGPRHKVVLTWLAQPVASGTATSTAVLLGGVGAIACALVGPRR